MYVYTIYIHTYIHTYIHIYIYIHIHTYIPIYIYIHNYVTSGGRLQDRKPPLPLRLRAVGQ